MNITNKTKRPISVPLPGGKKLFLGPGKVGQITARSAEHPPLRALVEAGDLELDDSGPGRRAGSADTATTRSGGQVGGPSGNIRRTGDR
jgi:hypothetical protein